MLQPLAAASSSMRRCFSIIARLMTSGGASPGWVHFAWIKPMRTGRLMRQRLRYAAQVGRAGCDSVVRLDLRQPPPMSTLATTVDGLALPNPFVIGSGPPGTNLNVIQRAFREGWGAVIAKTISLDASKVVNVAPRYGKHHALSGEVIGWENIELISDRSFDIWMDEFKKCKDSQPKGALIASIMEEYRKDAWI